MENATIISKFSIKSKTVDGNDARVTTVVFSNGVIGIEKKMLLNRESKIKHDLSRKFKDKYFYCDIISFKYDTLMCIAKTATRSLYENNVKPEDILR